MAKHSSPVGGGRGNCHFRFRVCHAQFCGRSFLDVRSRADLPALDFWKEITVTAIIATVEIDGRPTVAFEARNSKEASQLLKEHWFLEDLQELRTNGSPLWDGKARLRSRVASEEEIEKYEAMAAEAEDNNGDIVLAFLVPLDNSTEA